MGIGKISSCFAVSIYLLKGSDHSEFFIFACMKCVFVTDLRNKTMTSYTFSVRPTIPESKKVKITLKKFDEEENENVF